MDKLSFAAAIPSSAPFAFPARRTRPCLAWPRPFSLRMRSRSKTCLRCATSTPSAGCSFPWALPVELREGESRDRTTISCRTLSDPVARYEIVKTMRASSLVLGPSLPAPARPA